MNGTARAVDQGVSPAGLAAGREDLAAALRWSARLGLNEGVCNHYSLGWRPTAT